jgi:hypothetical protein
LFSQKWYPSLGQKFTDNAPPAGPEIALVADDTASGWYANIALKVLTDENP